jgi:hypothetical protein
MHFGGDVCVAGVDEAVDDVDVVDAIQLGN